MGFTRCVNTKQIKNILSNGILIMVPHNLLLKLIFGNYFLSFNNLQIKFMFLKRRLLNYTLLSFPNSYFVLRSVKWGLEIALFSKDYFINLFSCKDKWATMYQQLAINMFVIILLFALYFTRLSKLENWLVNCIGYNDW